MDKSQFDPALLNDLTDRQRQYVELRMQGFNPYQAAKKCGFERTYWSELEADPAVRKPLDVYFALKQTEHSVSLDDVVRGIKEGIEICTLQADGVGVINGWEKLARICGVAAPDKKELTITHEGQMAQLHYEQLDESKLLELVGRQRQLTLDVEDYEEVVDA